MNSPYAPHMDRKTTKIELDNGLKVLREAQNAYGRTQSDTYLSAKAKQHQNDEKFAEIVAKLKNKSKKYEEKIYATPTFGQMPPLMVNYGFYKPKDSALMGNCNHCAEAVQKLFGKRDIPSLNLVIDLYDSNKKPIGNHVFTLTNFPDGMVPTNPKTWGENAIITDMWSSFSMKLKDAMRYYENMFGANIKKCNFSLFQSNSIEQLKTIALKNIFR